MEETYYKVIFAGIPSEQNIEEVKQKLIELYKGDVSRVERSFFQGKRVVIMKNLDIQKAEDLKCTLTNRTGAIFQIEAMTKTSTSCKKNEKEVRTNKSKPCASRDSFQKEDKVASSSSGLNYNIVFYGEISNENDLNSVKNKLAEFFNTPAIMMEGMFTHDRVILKENINYQTAENYKRIFQETGALCRIEVARPIDATVINRSKNYKDYSKDNNELLNHQGNARPSKIKRKKLALILSILVILVIGGVLYNVIFLHDNLFQHFSNYVNKPNSEEARKELGQMGVDYSEDTFIERAENNDVVAVKLFIASGMDINTQGNYGYTALIGATKEHRLETIEMLIQKDSNIDIKDSDGKTALIIATESDSAEIVAMLLKGKANSNLKDPQGRTALMIAVEKGYTKITDPNFLC